MKIAHIADLHIGSHQYGIKDRHRDQYQTCELLAKAISDHDLILVAGDVFDSNDPTPDDIYCWVNMVKIMSSNGASVLACVGNHDKVLSSHLQWVDLAGLNPSNRSFMGGNRIDFSINTFDGLRVLSLDHIKRRDIKNVIEQIPAGIDIIMMHQSCVGFLSSIMRPEIDEDDLKTLSQKCKYLALGDLHVHKKMKIADSCYVAYPGNSEYLRLCDPHNDFKFLSVEYANNAVKSMESVSFTPFRPTQIFKFIDKASALRDKYKYESSFNIFRYAPEQSEEVEKFREQVESDLALELFHFHRDKPIKTKSEETDAEGVTESTDFIELVEKEPGLGDREIEIISDLWNNPDPENVISVLNKDLKEQINENN